MITAEQLEYQTADDADHDWAESYFFPIPLPDAGLLAHVYAVSRPVLGSMFNDVYVYGGLCSSRAQLLHHNSRQHLPAPARWSHVNSAFGLSIEATDAPRDYRIDYEGPDGTELHVEWTGLMDPFDIHDPAHSPNAGATASERQARSSAGDAYRGHFDMTGRVTGTLVVGGRSHRVDALERMDRSWGRRTEDVSAMNTLNANFGDDLAIHLRAPRPLQGDASLPTPVSHGYVYDRGEVYGVMSGEYRLTRMNFAVVGVEARIQDVRGKEFELFGHAQVGAPWTAYAGTVTWNCMITWQLNGRRGHGIVMESTPLGHGIAHHSLTPEHINTWLQA